MGCGCKNKGNQNNQTPPTPQEVKAQKVQLAKQVNEDVKSAIKKTIEKYYNKNKS